MVASLNIHLKQTIFLLDFWFSVGWIIESLRLWIRRERERERDWNRLEVGGGDQLIFYITLSDSGPLENDWHD